MDGQTSHERAHAESLRRCPETCPAVDAAIRDVVTLAETEFASVRRGSQTVGGAVDILHWLLTVQLARDVKIETMRLRTAFVAACEELAAARAEAGAAYDLIAAGRVASALARLDRLRSAREGAGGER